MKQARFRHIKRELESLLQRKPKNCANNVQVRIGDSSGGVCRLDLLACDDLRGDRAQKCEVFKHSHGKEDVKKSLQDFFDNRSIPDIAIRYPDVAALLWVLDGESFEEDIPPAGREDYFPGSVLAGSFSNTRVWVDSEEDALRISQTFEGFDALKNKVASLEREIQEKNLEALKYREGIQEKDQEILKYREEIQELRGLSDTRERSFLGLVKTLEELRGEIRSLKPEAGGDLQISKKIPLWERLFG
jgi:hypothetical protein